MSLRTPLFVDWLTITISVADSKQANVLRRLEELELDEVLRRENNPHSELLKSYRLAYYVEFNEKISLRIQARPRKAGSRFLRIEWNPEKVSNAIGSPTSQILEILQKCIENFSFEDLLKANITRIDFSFDLRRISVDSIKIFTTLRKTYNNQYFHVHKEYDRTGTLNSVGIGRSDSDQYLLIYDKTLERETRQFSTIPTRRNDSIAKPSVKRIKTITTRFEVRLRKVGKLEDLITLTNPFLKYQVTSFTNIGLKKVDYVWKLFLDSCDRRGIHNALSMIDDRKVRSAYALAVAELSPPAWWKPEVIWSEMPQAIARVLGVS